MGDADYLACLGNAVSLGLSKFKPELICYVAGADPYREDQLGGLSLTIEGLKERDALVFRIAKGERIPVMVTLAGGYAHKLEDTITIHCNTVVAAKEIFGRKVAATRGPKIGCGKGTANDEQRTSNDAHPRPLLK